MNYFRDCDRYVDSKIEKQNLSGVLEILEASSNNCTDERTKTEQKDK